MSLEAAIQENTNALRDLINIMSSGSTPDINVVGKKEDGEVVDLKDAKAKKEAKVKKTTAKKEPKAENTATPKDDSKPTEVTYDEAASAVTTLARTKGRDVAIEVLGKFGIVKLPDAKSEQYAEIIAACTEAGEA